MEILRNIPLNSLTTLRLGGPAAYLIHIASIEVLREAIEWAQGKNLPLMVLGEGSNVLAPDEGHEGLVLIMNIKGLHVIETGSVVELVACAGENWDGLVKYAIENGLYGIENLSGIPGSVGATPIQNIGAYGTEIKNMIKWVEIFDPKTMKTVKLYNNECGFGYRDSIFKNPQSRSLIVTRVCFILKKHGILNTSYRDVSNYFKEKDVKPTLISLRTAILSIRGKKFPNLYKVGTAGSFFKNPIIRKKDLEILLKTHKDLPFFEIDEDKDKVKIPLAWILEHVCNMKGWKRGNFETFSKHALVFVHSGNGTTKELKEFASMVAQCVKEKTNIDIQPEVTYL